jgi:hypothetical protein
MIGYGVDGNLIDEYFQMSNTTCHDSMYKLCKAVIGVFDEVYLRELNVADTVQLLTINEARGFSEIIGIIYCMPWE